MLSFTNKQIDQLRERLKVAVGAEAAVLRYIISSELSVWERNHVDRNYALHRDAMLESLSASVSEPKDSSVASSVFSDGARVPAAADGSLYLHPSEAKSCVACTDYHGEWNGEHT